MALFINVRDAALEATANSISQTLSAVLQVLSEINTSLQSLLAPSAEGMFNPPLSLVKIKPVEVMMSVLELQVGQTANDKLTFNEPTPPADGAVASDNAGVATISLASDMVSWTCVGVSPGVANITYTGTSAPPDVGPAVVAPMVVTVIAVPVAEQGDFNPGSAVITGP